MIQLYNDDFVLTLSNQEVSFTETNGWLDGNDFKQYSLPFTMVWEPENTFFFNLLNSNPKRLFKGYITLEGKIRSCEIEVLEFDDLTVEFAIYYGLKQLPGYDRLLSSFNFPLIQTSDIFTHADSISTQTINSVDYNFPQIIKEYPTDIEGFEDYSGILNKYDETDGYSIDGQILRPYLYLLYVLEFCFQELGYQVSGTFFNSLKLQRALLVTHSEFHFIGGGHLQTEFTSADIINTYYEVQNGVNVEMQHFKKSIDPMLIEYGNLRMEIVVPAGYETSIATLKMTCNGIVLNEFTHIGVTSDPNSPDVLFDNPTLLPEQVGHPIEFELMIPKTWSDENLAGKFTIDVHALTTDSTPTTIPQIIINPNHIDLGKLLPENMTFGDLFDLVRESCKPVVYYQGSTIVLDLGSNLTDNINAIDLRAFEINHVPRKFNGKSSFEFKYKGSDDDSDNQNKMFIDYNGINTENYTINENTEEIEISLQPLFFNTVSGFYTAEIKTGANNNLVFYEYSVNDRNCIDDLSNVSDWYNYFFREYIRFKLNPETIDWSFSSDFRFIQDLAFNSFIYAYDNYYLINSLEKKQLQPYTFEYKVEAIKFLT